MVATVNGEKIVYINENLTQTVRDINIIPAEFTKIAKERYKLDYNTIQEAIDEYVNEQQKLLNESGVKSINWLQ
jgi:hypothetical protein